MKVKQLVVGELEGNCYLLASENELGVIDPGGEAEKILEEIRKAKAEPKYIINTHYHPDHTGANEKIRDKTGAKILIHEKERDFIGFKADEFLKDGEEIKIGESILKVIHTPGHTSGSICLLGQGFVLTGDTIFKDGYGRTDLAGGSQKELENSLKKLSGLLKLGTSVYPGHGEPFQV